MGVPIHLSNNKNSSSNSSSHSRNIISSRYSSIRYSRSNIIKVRI